MNPRLLSRGGHVRLLFLPAMRLQPGQASPEVTKVDDLYPQLGGHLQWQKLRALQKVLQHRGVRFSLLDNERLSAELVSQYLGVKRRQLL